MIRILGSNKRFCDGLTRRDMLHIGALAPLAGSLDRSQVRRTLTHQFPIHGTAFAMPAVPTTALETEGGANDSRHWPFIGSVVDYLADQADPKPPAVPRNFGLPFQLGSR